MESLKLRVERLGEELGAPVPEGEVKEEERRKTLERYISNYAINLFQLIFPPAKFVWVPRCK